MISRRRCKKIAQEWAIRQGSEEYRRRTDSIRRQDDEFRSLARKSGQPFEVDMDARRELNRNAAEMLLRGYYDPPTPKIPGIIARLRLNDWTPPMSTVEEWPMGSAATR